MTQRREITLDPAKQRSSRGMRLFLNPEWVHYGGPIVTVEDYLKWYNVFVIQPDGSIVVASEAYSDLWYSMEGRMPSAKSFYGDHCWHPGGIEMFAELIGGVVDPDALGALTVRWIRECQGKDLIEL
jgi:hypothetical protein